MEAWTASKDPCQTHAGKRALWVHEGGFPPEGMAQRAQEIS
eukprot:CAMPEP_0205899280 /NCGR_PEP_ID=MMETSP1083-20121108/26512_1 /ASSEMBLY_ACC=CAM_ASM_000430 /TAXON_ID=97485 /ORGANISM="Prymnesium parvum, Strain Texoma1" /LENGTH=40 /DNA_ID= /DNA_START= /DNA_END= /DNA_ORIENTATION=